MKKLGTFLALIFFFSASASAKIHQVPSPHIPTIQGGIDLAENGDTVLVLAGIYYENINFRGKNILVASNFIFDQDTNTIHNTIIDGSDTASVVTFNSNEDSTASIQGFTIRHGCYYKGAGILCEGSSVHIAYNIIKENSASPDCAEPGMYPQGGGIGAGILCNDCSGIIEHNYIINNRCLRGNWGGGLGGGICNMGRKSLIIRYNLIAWNQVDVGWSVFEGGGGILTGDSSTTLIYNNTIVYNQAQDGGGIYNFSWLPGSKIFNNIVAFNSEGIRVFDSPGYLFSPLIAYNDVWGNVKGNFYGGFAGTGDTTWGFNSNGVPCDSFYNIIRDPLFVDTINFDFHLSATSPCIDAGDPVSPLDPDNTIADMGAFYYDQSQTFVKDDETSSPVEFELSENYPNPFNPTTTIQFRVRSSEFREPIRTTLTVYNILGQKVRTLVDGERLPGEYKVIWDGKDNSNREVSSGIYFYQLKTENYTETKKMVLLR